MADILIRNVPDDVIAAVDANAIRAELSRVEYLRRMLERECSRAPEVTLDDFRRLAETCADARDPEFIASAWR
ncbi:antitoxin [Candidatus Poriferisodalis sp.]|uniref:type II toxin-antitoxin system VapB family antitoxin n=1 Tax=Candidatus Poriferisodalis sp. TaxID=3101277 RepID=UPI003C6F7C0D